MLRILEPRFKDHVVVNVIRKFADFPTFSFPHKFEAKTENTLGRESGVFMSGMKNQKDFSKYQGKSPYCLQNHHFIHIGCKNKPIFTFTYILFIIYDVIPKQLQLRTVGHISQHFSANMYTVHIISHLQ